MYLLVLSSHMWVCTRHKSDNKEALEKFKTKYEKDYKLDFGLVVTIGSLYGHINPESAKAKRKKIQSSSPQSLGGAKKKRRTKLTGNDTQVLNQEEGSINNKVKSGKDVTKKTSRKHNQQRSPKRMSSKEATQILKRKLPKMETRLLS